MKWNMVTDPLNHVALSAVLASLPILFMFWALAIKRMKMHTAAPIAVGIAIVITILPSGIGYGMPAQYSLLSVFYGFITGVFPIMWIVIVSMFLYNLSVKMGQFEIISKSLANITDDRRMQALLIGFAFGAFLEGAAGYGAPVAITAAMLVGMGFNPLYAASVCLLANTAPVAFGAIGLPILMAGQASGIDSFAISQMVGRTLPFLSVLVPLYLVILMAGWKKGFAVWPACLVSGVSFASVQFLSANYLGPLLPDILASLAAIFSTILFLKIWKPKEIFRFPDEKASVGVRKVKYTAGQQFRAWAPFVVMTVFVAAWGVPDVGAALDKIFVFKWKIPWLHDSVMIVDSAGKSIAKSAVYKFNFLSTAATAILVAYIFAVPIMGASVKTAIQVMGEVLYKYKLTIFGVAMILGFAKIYEYSGMAITLGNALASTGAVYPFFAGFLGWLGVFVTGSDTSTNALFGKLQQVTATQIGVDPVITVAANTSGGVCGKMISPQSIAVATAATNLVGKESDIFRFTLKHSLILTTSIAIIVTLQAYVFKWMVPTYATKAAASATSLNAQTGFVYLAVAVVASLCIVGLSRIFGGKKLLGDGIAENEFKSATE